MKLVHSPSMVAHLFMNRSQTEARNSGKTLFFEGPTIFSYGHHYEIARHVEFNGKKAILFNANSSSPTTNQHRSDVRKAAQGQLILDTPYMQNPPRPESGVITFIAEVMSYWSVRQKMAATKAARARTSADQCLAEYRSCGEKANAYIDFWELGFPHLPLVPTADVLAKCLEQAKVETKREAARNKQKRLEKAERAEQIKLESKQQLAEWLAGKPFTRPPRDLPEVYMRVNGDNVETSMGAEFPVTHAARIFKVIARCIRTGVPYQKNGHTEHVGQFAVDSISAEGNVKAGCHYILYPEIKRIADLIGAKE